MTRIKNKCLPNAVDVRTNIAESLFGQNRNGETFNTCCICRAYSRNRRATLGVIESNDQLVVAPAPLDQFITQTTNSDETDTPEYIEEPGNHIQDAETPETNPPQASLPHAEIQPYLSAYDFHENVMKLCDRDLLDSIDLDLISQKIKQVHQRHLICHPSCIADTLMKYFEFIPPACSCSCGSYCTFRRLQDTTKNCIVAVNSNITGIFDIKLTFPILKRLTITIYPALISFKTSPKTSG